MKKTGKNEYHTSPEERWIVIGRALSGKTYFRHLCWDCFFKKLRAENDIPRLARKGKWYAKIVNGDNIPPAACTSPSFYYKYLFDITDEELEFEHKKFDTASKESFVRRFGPEEGPKRFENMQRGRHIHALVSISSRKKG